ncbi:MAG: hypothetical protein J6X60_01030 [Ruminiclostridium sp.]|nr:hypothetical protein [Ruminiclostridium sp.]
MNKNRKNIALILNIAAFICGSVGIVFRLVRSFDDFFLYYTQLSNVAGVISSAIYIAFRSAESAKIRRFTVCARYLSSCMLMMTFIVVMCIFIPFGTPRTTLRLMGSVNGVLHHAVCPIISVVSYIFFEDGVRSRRSMLIPIISTAIYAAVVYALNFMRLADAPYPFFEVYDHPAHELVLWFFGLMALVSAIAAAVRFANIKFSRGKDERV